MVAWGGGIIRDVCIGAIPPAGLADGRYLVLALVASALAMMAYPLLQRLDHPVQMFDALGLSFFAVFGAHKALAFGHNRSEEHTSELQPLMRNSYAVFCLNKKNK